MSRASLTWILQHQFIASVMKTMDTMNGIVKQLLFSENLLNCSLQRKPISLCKIFQ